MTISFLLGPWQNLFSFRLSLRSVSWSTSSIVSYSRLDARQRPQTSKWRCLRNKDITVLQASNTGQAASSRDDLPLPLFYWTPCTDGDYLHDLPYTLFETRRFVRGSGSFWQHNGRGQHLCTQFQEPDRDGELLPEQLLQANRE